MAMCGIAGPCLRLISVPHGLALDYKAYPRPMVPESILDAQDRNAYVWVAKAPRLKYHHRSLRQVIAGNHLTGEKGWPREGS